MRTIETFEVERQFDSLVDEVQLGGSIVITRHGKPVARLVAECGSPPKTPEAVVAAIREFRKSMPRLTLDEIQSSIREGRRY